MQRRLLTLSSPSKDGYNIFFNLLTLCLSTFFRGNDPQRQGFWTEAESSRTHFEVLGLKRYKSSKMPWLCLEDSIVFWLVNRKITKHKNFLNSGICVARMFDWGSPICKSHAIWRHQKIFKRKTFYGTKMSWNYCNSNVSQSGGGIPAAGGYGRCFGNFCKFWKKQLF